MANAQNTPKPLRDDDPRHGSNPGYNAGCRNPCCRHAHMVHMKKYRLYGPALGHISALGTQRRIQALAALGYTLVAISEHLGMSRSYAQQLLNAPTVRTSTDRSVRELYERLCMVRPEGWACDRARRQAVEKRWVPPLAWDDIDTDQRPQGVGNERGPAPKPCGTEAAYRRHLRHNETPCDTCRLAHSAFRNTERSAA